MFGSTGRRKLHRQREKRIEQRPQSERLLMVIILAFMLQVPCVCFLAGLMKSDASRIVVGCVPSRHWVPRFATKPSSAPNSSALISSIRYGRLQRSLPAEAHRHLR